MNGAIILDKPAGITSHDAVNRVRRICRQRQVGHLGTLDPFATGVLVMLLGKATRLARYYSAATKTYEAVMRVGFATDTYDFTGTPTGPERTTTLNCERLVELFREFTGTRLQQPPAYSAKKIAGVPAYRLARRGRGVNLAPVVVSIHVLRLLEIKGQLVKFCVTVSSGTYIRSISHEVGERLGVGAHLTGLRRMGLAELSIEQSVTLEALESQAATNLSAMPALVPMELLLPDLPSAMLSEDDFRRVANGQSLLLAASAERLRLFSPEGRLAAVAVREHGGDYHPEVVLCEPASRRHEQEEARGSGGSRVAGS